MKILVNFLILLGLACMAYLGHRFATYPTLTTPLPYRLAPQSINKRSVLEKAHVLIVGDRMARSLFRYQTQLKRKLDQHLGRQLTVEWLGEDNDGLHRTFEKITQLKQLPHVIIYQGASRELAERKFLVQYKDVYLRNFKRSKHEILSGLIYAWPWSSKFIFDKMPILELKSLQPATPDIPTRARMDQFQLSYKIFEYELENFVQYVRLHNANLILTTTPINLQVPPKQVCDMQTTHKVDHFLKRLKQVLEKGDSKTVYQNLLKLSESANSHAMLFYHLANVAHRLHKTEEARRFYKMANALDCQPWRANSVYNSIIRYVAKKYGIPLVDFQELIYRDFYQETYFVDELFPQPLYYDQFVDELYRMSFPMFES